MKSYLLALGLTPFLILMITRLEQDGVTAGEFTVEPSTLHSLGFEWKIEGDENRDAVVEVSFRKVGENIWKTAQPMLRIGGEKVWRAREFLEYWTPHMFAGSIFGLDPGERYECRFEMSDPDGVNGIAIQQVNVETRRVPQSYPQGPVLHVYPPNHEGNREEPSFTGLLEAYYGPGLGDWDVVRCRPVEPGATILVHAGLYKADRRDYINPHQIPFFGSYVLTLDGTEEKPITIKAAGDGEVIFDGDNAFRLFDVMAADHHIFEGITVRNTEVAFYGGAKDVMGCSNLSVRYCRLEDVGIGVHTDWAGAKNFYIADNTMIGRDDHHRLNGWANMKTYGPSPVNSYYGVKVYGQGHVICHNKISFFHDGICISTYGIPEEEQDLKCVSIDIFNNDIFLMVDDFIESDGGVHNIRVFNNRGFNAAHQGLSAQPMFGGPVYFIGNLIYNVPFGGAIKTGGANPAGVLIYHNTFITENSNVVGISNVHFRNNLFFGTNHPTKHLFRLITYTHYSTSDYNGFGYNQSVTVPPFSIAIPKHGPNDYSARPEPLLFDNLDDLRGSTGLEENSRIVTTEIFRNIKQPDARFPHKVYLPDGLDFNLVAGCDAIDAGVILPNINDGFEGSAPDLGAFEYGRDHPVYGPREYR